MKNIKYVGTSDFREISAEDFDRIDVKPGKEEAEGLRFSQGEIKEVTDAVAEALMENISFVTEFVELSDEDIKKDQEAAKEAERERVAAHREALLGGTPSPTASSAVPAGVAAGGSAGGTARAGGTAGGGGAVGNGSST